MDKRYYFTAKLNSCSQQPLPLNPPFQICDVCCISEMIASLAGVSLYKAKAPKNAKRHQIPRSDIVNVVFVLISFLVHTSSIHGHAVQPLPCKHLPFLCVSRPSVRISKLCDPQTPTFSHIVVKIGRFYFSSGPLTTVDVLCLPDEYTNLFPFLFHTFPSREA